MAFLDGLCATLGYEDGVIYMEKRVGGILFRGQAVPFKCERLARDWDDVEMFMMDLGDLLVAELKDYRGEFEEKKKTKKKKSAYTYAELVKANMLYNIRRHFRGRVQADASGSDAALEMFNSLSCVKDWDRQLENVDFSDE